MSSPRAEHLRDEGTHTQVVLAGAASGLIARFCIAPLDVLKIRLQLQYHSITDPISRGAPQTPSGVILVARNIVQNEGLTAFWKGNIPAEGLYLSYGACQFLAYRVTNQAIEKYAEDSKKAIPGGVKSFVSGAVAGSAATSVTYPLDLLRTRFAAVGTEKVYDGLVASMREITRDEGFKGFFRGVSAAIGQIVPYMGLFFAFYEGFKVPLNNISLPFSSGDAVAGMSASVLSKSAVYPLDTVRKRLQVQGPSRTKYIGGSRIPIYENGVLNTLLEIAKKEGMVGLYRGLTVSLMKAAPASAVTMWTYERAIHVLMAAEKKVERSIEP